MSKRKETICLNCKVCYKTTEQNLIDNYDKYKYCSTCRKNHKNCEICNKEIFVQARTCSNICANKLKEKTYYESCGDRHHFASKSSVRIKIQDDLKKKYGVDNVFQLESVKLKTKEHFIEKYGVEFYNQTDECKDKKKETFHKNYGVDNIWLVENYSEYGSFKEHIDEIMLQKYGQKRISNGLKISETKHSDEFRKKMEYKGLYVPLEDLTEFQIYKYHVQKFTKKSLKMFGDNKFGLNWQDKIFKWYKFSIDHNFSKKSGFFEKIPPCIIGHICNLEMILQTENASKQGNNNITIDVLLDNIRIFENENKKNNKKI